MKLIKIFFCAAVIFSATFSSASAFTNISNDNVETFIGNCNTQLQAADPNSKLDVPTASSVFKTYSDTLQISENLQVKATYTLRDDKLFSIRLKADNYTSEVKELFEGMSIIFLKAIGLTEDEAKGLVSSGDESEWKREGFISRMNKKIVVTVKNSTLLIFADDN